MNPNSTYLHDLRKTDKLPGVLFIVFYLSLLLASQFPEINTIITRFIAPLFAIYCFFLYVFKKERIPLEFYMYGLFVVWCLSGIFIVKDFDLYLSYLSLIAQIEVLLFCIIVIIGRTGKVDYFFTALIFYAVMLPIISLFFQGNLFNVQYSDKYRLDSVGANPNTFGYAMLLAIFSIAYFLRTRKSLLVYVFYIALAIFFSIGIVYTASRKTFATMIIFYLLWIFFCLVKQTSKRPIILIIIVLLIASVFQVYEFTMEETFLGERLTQYYSYQDMRSKSDRFWMMDTAWDYFVKYPITGIGLGQFAALSGYGYYTHSDFFEIISTTGLIGAAIYFSVYIILISRLRRLWSKLKSEKEQYELKLFGIIILCLTLIGLGNPLFLSIDLLPMIYVIATYSNNLENIYQSNIG